MNFKSRTINQLAEMICGNVKEGDKARFIYRSSSYLTSFFEECDLDYRHDGTTRDFWVAGVLEDILKAPQEQANVPPPAFIAVIQRLMDRTEPFNESGERFEALAILNGALAREGYEAFYAEDRICYLRHTATKTLAMMPVNPQRPLSAAECEKLSILSSFLETASEDEFIENILLPLFRQLGFRRITSAGHKDKALEYGKDVWMKFTLPTLHNLYFGIQAKRGKLDAAGMTKNNNVAEVLAQIRMMLGHQVFDPEINKRVLVDHAIIVAAGEITKQARNWLGEQLDASSRSQILFMERDDILNLYIVNNVPLPAPLTTKNDSDMISPEDIPF